MTLNGGRGSNRKYSPFAFTKEGVTVLKTLMKSQVEIDFSEEPSLPAVIENYWNEGTVVLYQPDNRSVNLEVKVTEENVWLNRSQIAILFDRDIKTISKHINNSLQEELLNVPTVANFATVQIEGGREVTRYIEFYNLDMVLSVGYRVKSSNGISFRRWANKVLKENILSQNTIIQRFERIENRVTKAEEKIDFFVKTSLPPRQTIFKDGQIYDAYALISNLIESANHRVILIDNYVNTQILTLLDKRKEDVKATIYTYPNHIKDPIFR